MRTIHWPRSLQIVLVVTWFVLVGCSASAATDPSTTANTMISATRTPDAHTQDGGVVSFTIDGLHISVPRPPSWQHYLTDYGIVIAEALGSVATDGRLGGLLTHVFVPPLENVDMPIVQGQGHNSAWMVLSQITRQPDYIGSALVSEPVAFEWGGHEAAYYLVDNGEGNLTIVIGLIVADTGHLIACSISAPADQAYRIRESLADLLDNLTVNGSALHGAELSTILPEELDFPQRIETS